MLKEKITTESKKLKISLRDDKILHAIIKYSKNNCTKPPISALFCIGSLLLTFHVCFLCMWKGREGSEKSHDSKYKLLQATTKRAPKT